MKTEDKDFFRITNYVRQKFGVCLEGKRAFVEKGLEQILQDSNLNSIEALMNEVEAEEGNEFNAILIRSLVTNYTFFMREELHFEILTEVILPKLYKRQGKQEGIRIWSAASSSGQEIYSILMVIHEFLKEEVKDWNIKVIGTDISDIMIKQAKEGIYTKEEVQGMEVEWLSKYFTLDKRGNYSIKDKIKKNAEFELLNLVSEFQFDETFQVIFLRNVLIYFERGLVEVIVDKIADYLEYGGYLFLGLTETIEIHSPKLMSIQPSVYRKV